MAYSDFTLEETIKRFSLSQAFSSLFIDLSYPEISPWLHETLATSLRLALPSGNEKARSEFAIAPILLEIEKAFSKEIFIFSGKNLDVDRNLGLHGECDFILSRGTVPLIIQAPILGIVEAKKDDIDGGIGQCAAQMVGAQRFNQRHEQKKSCTYGCVTSGEIWQFLKLSGELLTIDSDRYYINQVEKIVGCLRAIVEEALEN